MAGCIYCCYASVVYIMLLTMPCSLAPWQSSPCFQTWDVCRLLPDVLFQTRALGCINYLLRLWFCWCHTGAKTRKWKCSLRCDVLIGFIRRDDHKALQSRSRHAVTALTLQYPRKQTRMPRQLEGLLKSANIRSMLRPV